jgi:Fur family transcriptional regulator, ferric uptake regulator
MRKSPRNCPRLRKHQELRNQLESMLSDIGRQPDKNEQAVIDSFLQAGGHVTVAELTAEVSAACPEVDSSCVRGVLRMLERLGIARRVQAQGQEYYEHLHVGEHHDHMICVRCGRFQEFLDEQIESRQLKRARLAGFQPLFHRLQMFGICADCMAARESVVPLNEMLPGETGEIESIAGGRGAAHRLTEMGLTRGTLIEVMTSRGPVLVMVRGSRVAISRGLARKVIVKRAEI